MQAIEFNSYVSNGLVKIPYEYGNYNNQKVKIIMLYTEQKHGNYDKKEFLSAIENAQELNAFSKIKNSVEWQKKIRNEWE